MIVNPEYGDHANDGTEIAQLLREEFADAADITPGILLRENTTLEAATEALARCEHDSPTLIHSGFTEGGELAAMLGENLPNVLHVFIESRCGRLYRRHFRNGRRILLRDGFTKRRNADHPPVEEFSDLHATFPEEGMQGFGDFLIVGDDYSEGGGPAYAVAIHLTYIDPDRDDAMYLYHFVSRSRATPTDPAGKFSEALEALLAVLNDHGCKLDNTSAVQEFRRLAQEGHFPGLGYVKKLSMKHHIETMAEFDLSE